MSNVLFENGQVLTAEDLNKAFNEKANETAIKDLGVQMNEVNTNLSQRPTYDQVKSYINSLLDNISIEALEELSLKIEEINRLMTLTTVTDTIPIHVLQGAEKIANKIHCLKKENPDHKIFTLGAITDLHYKNSDYTQYGIPQAIQALKYLEAKREIDCFAVLGDYTDGYAAGGNDAGLPADEEEDMNIINYYLNKMLTSVNLRQQGNHDFDKEQQDKIIQLIQEYSTNVEKGYVDDKYKGFYYKDFNDFHLRIISINANEISIENNDRIAGTIACSEEQYQWIVDTITDPNIQYENTPWQILFISHQPLDYYTQDCEMRGWVFTIPQIFKLYTDVQNSATALTKTQTDISTSYAKLTFEFNKNNTRAKLIANIHGHIHNYVYGGMFNKLDAQHSGTNGVYRVATPDAGGNTQNHYTGGPYNQRITYNKTKTESSSNNTAFAIYCIDLTEQKIYAYHYGAGPTNDRIIDYSVNSITNYHKIYSDNVSEDININIQSSYPNSTPTWSNIENNEVQSGYSTKIICTSQNTINKLQIQMGHEEIINISKEISVTDADKYSYTQIENGYQIIINKTRGFLDIIGSTVAAGKQFTITTTLSDVSIEASHNTTIWENENYQAKLTPYDSTKPMTVHVYMGEDEITQTAYNSDKQTITIAKVTGNITIWASIPKDIIYTISTNLTNISLSNTSSSIKDTETYSSGLIYNGNNSYGDNNSAEFNVSITMGGADISNAYNPSTQTITIQNPTGDIVIKATGYKNALKYAEILEDEQEAKDRNGNWLNHVRLNSNGDILTFAEFTDNNGINHPTPYQNIPIDDSDKTYPWTPYYTQVTGYIPVKSTDIIRFYNIEASTRASLTVGTDIFKEGRSHYSANGIKSGPAWNHKVYLAIYKKENNQFIPCNSGMISGKVASSYLSALAWTHHENCGLYNFAYTKTDDGCQLLGLRIRDIINGFRQNQGSTGDVSYARRWVLRNTENELDNENLILNDSEETYYIRLSCTYIGNDSIITINETNGIDDPYIKNPIWYEEKVANGTNTAYTRGQFDWKK